MIKGSQKIKLFKAFLTNLLRPEELFLQLRLIIIKMFPHCREGVN